MLIENVRKLGPFQRLVYWIKEREAIRLKKEVGEPRPWTDDEILRTFRFTCVRRMDDRVSRWLMENWYKPYRDHPNMLYAVALARFFNLPSTLEAITDLIFCEGLPKWGEIKVAVRKLRKSGEGPVFNGAYVIRGNDGTDKVQCVVDYNVKRLWKGRIEVDSSSMQETHSRVHTVYGFGSFMAGQVVADLRWAISGTWKDRNNWAPLGPGSLKGMNYLHGRSAKQPLKQEQFLQELTEVRDYCRAELPDSTTSRLEMMDYQNVMCEYRAYVQALDGIKRPKRRYK